MMETGHTALATFGGALSWEGLISFSQMKTRGLDGVTRAAGRNTKGSLAGLALTPYDAPAPSLQSCQQASNFPSCYHSQLP